jgi:hypothetical protein
VSYSLLSFGKHYAVQGEISELEQRRKRVINELQAKRKAELEKKKLTIDADQSKKREAQRFAMFKLKIEEYSVGLLGDSL